jgi:preprotein translocase subunit SecF
MGLSRRERREQRKKVLKEQRLQQLKSIEEHEKQFSRKKEYKGFLKFYEKHYLTLEIIPIILMILAIVAIGHQVATTGDFMNKGVSLKGGMTITISTNSSVSVTEIEKILKTKFPKDDIQVQSIAEFGVQQALIISTDNLNEEQQYLTAMSSLIPDVASKASVETTGSSLGGGFFNQTMLAMIIAFVCMSIVVFISFKDFWPSLMVISCALVDIIEPLAVINLLGIKVSTAGIAAFLMLIGYSVDTDILLTSRVLRGKEGTVFDRTVSAAKTGLLMTFSTLAAVTIGFFLTQSSTIKEIMTIMIIGLLFDIINTWIQNVALLRYHIEHIRGKKHAEPLPSQAVVEEEKLDDEAADDFEQAEKEVEEEESKQED